jgi:hypothetical protein
VGMIVHNCNADHLASLHQEASLTTTFRIISISWGINAPEDGGLSKLPHIIEKIRPSYISLGY